MIKLPLVCVAAVLAAAVSAPAQVSIEGRLGRSVRGEVTLGRDAGHHNHRDSRGNRPVLRDHRDHRDRRNDSRHGHDHHSHGRWETVHEQVLVPGYWREDHVPATYGWITEPCGHRYWGIVDQGGCRRVWVPARWETRCRQVW